VRTVAFGSEVEILHPSKNRFWRLCHQSITDDTKSEGPAQVLSKFPLAVDLRLADQGETVGEVVGAVDEESFFLLAGNES